MLAQFGYVALFLVAASLFILFTLGLPSILRKMGIVPNKPSKVKEATYECGMETIGRSWIQFNFRYYFYALLLIALDILAIFLYPWAANVKQLGLAGFFGALIFIFIIGAGYFYAWKKRVLEWQ